MGCWEIAVSALLDFKHCASYGLAFVDFLNFNRAEQLRRCFRMPGRESQDVSTL